jgi:8-oxo-dGTP pyrophosphatase MutT (NUDIX family)
MSNPPKNQAYTLSRRLGHPRERHEGKPVRPKDAASLIAVKDGKSGPEVLMGRRSRKASFIPDAFVFPGGRFDADDRSALPGSALDAPVSKMGVRGNAGLAIGLAMTAVRETYEETGLLLAQAGDVGNCQDETWQEMRQLGMAPDLARLSYLGRAITSPYSPIRFHARFFLARGEHLNGTLGGSGELSDLDWFPLSEATKLPIVDVTEFMLGEIARVMDEPGAENHKPVFAYRLDAPFVRYD